MPGDGALVSHLTDPRAADPGADGGRSTLR